MAKLPVICMCSLLLNNIVVCFPVFVLRLYSSVCQCVGVMSADVFKFLFTACVTFMKVTAF